MSASVDKRVVEMRFDNSQFESNAKTTMNTLTRLKTALGFTDSTKALQNLDKASKNISFADLASSVEALEKRFSTLGIVGMTVISNITTALTNTLAKGISYVTDSIVSGGIKRAMNIENAHFQLQALLKDETKVQAVMADAMESVDGTAYAYDEAAKAASQFAASGIEAGEDMLNALKGITGVAAMTNSSFEDISKVFTTVAGNGRLMGDQLLQLSSRGLNAASTLADYYREVQNQSKITEADVRDMVSKGKVSFKDFSDAMTWAFGDSAKRANETFTGALSNMKSALARIGAGFISPLVEQNGELVKLFNALRIQINNVKSALVFDEQTSAISGLAEVSGMTDEKLTDMFATIKKNGSVSTKELKKLEKNNVSATASLTDYINGVTNGTIRASYATTTALEELTNGTEVSEKQVKKFVKNGKISLDIFTSAMETSYGNQKALTKQFTDFFLDEVSKIVKAIENTDLTSAMETFYYGLEIVKNLFKGLWSVIKPLGSAIKEVFFSFSDEQVLNVASAIKELTSKMKLSEKSSKNLKDAFTGVLNVVKLLLTGLLNMVGVSTKALDPMGSLLDLFLSLLGAMGRGLTSLTEWIAQSPVLATIFDIISAGFAAAADGLSWFIKQIDKFLGKVDELGIAQKVIDVFVKSINKMGEVAAPYVEILKNKLSELKAYLSEMIPKKLNSLGAELLKLLENLNISLDKVDPKPPTKAFGMLTTAISNLVDVITGNKGVSSAVDAITTFGTALKNGFSFDLILSNIDKFRVSITDFVSWFKTTVGPAFADFNIGSAIGAAAGGTMIYSIVKIANTIENLSKKLPDFGKLVNSLSGALGEVGNTLVAYQKNLKADTLLKIAGAIAVLCVALTVMSFADTKKLLAAAIALGVVGGVLIAALDKYSLVQKKSKNVNDAINTFATGLSKSMQNLSKAAKYKAIGSMIKSIAESVLMVVAAILIIGYAYKKDPQMVETGGIIVGIIVGVFVGIIALMSVLGKKLNSGMNAFGKASLGILALSTALNLTIVAMKKLFKMELPDDYKTKLAILAGIFGGLAVMTILLQKAAKDASGKVDSKPILALAASVYIVVLAVNKLFAMELGDDWKVKAGILAGIFVGLAALIVVIGVAQKLAGGTIKGMGVLLSLALLIGVVVGALVVLSLFPAAALLKGAVALGLVLLSLAGTMYGVGKITEPDSYKAVLAMALMVGVITAALSVLSMIPAKALLKAAVALGTILLTLAVDFLAISKISNEKVYMTVLAMAIIVGTIALSLAVLAKQPIEGLAAGALAMTAVLLAVAVDFVAISKMTNAKVYANIIAMVAAIAVISVSLYALSNQPWEGLLAGATALSEVLLAMSAAILIASTAPTNPAGLAAFIVALGSVLLIAYALYQLAQQPWPALLAAGTAISEVLLAMAATLAILTMVGAAAPAALIGIGLLDVLIVDLVALMVGIGALFEKVSALEGFLDKGIEILIKVGDGLGRFVGSIVAGALSEVSAILPKIGLDLSLFWVNASIFFNGIKSMDSQTFTNIGLLAGAIIALTVAELVNGVASFFGCDLAGVGKQLGEFWDSAKSFFDGISGLKPESVEAANKIAAMILSLTAAELINGLMNFIGIGGGSLADFGKELSEFGPYIRDFAATVKDVTPEAVQGAADAAKIMAEVEKTLPSHDGLLQKIMGDKSLADFGQELLLFGPSIKAFAMIVKDIKSEAVEGAAAAANIMSEVEANLPAQDGLKQKIMGDKKLSEFGQELLAFAPSIVAFCTIVKDLKASAVINVAIITKVMTMLADDLPTSSDSFKGFFTGKQDFKKFGETLESFGKSMVEFAKKVSGIKFDNLSSTLKAVGDLLDMGSKLNNFSTKGVESFANSLKKMADNGVKSFTKQFSDSKKEVENAVSKMVKYVSDAVVNKQNQIISKGVQTGTKLINSIRDAVKDGASGLQTRMTKLGKNACEGFRDGITNNISIVKKAAERLADAVDKSVCVKLEIHSPSRVAKLRGYQWCLGMEAGLAQGTGIIKTRIMSISNELISLSRTAIANLSDSLSNIGVTVPTFDWTSTINNIKGYANILQAVETADEEVTRLQQERASNTEKMNKAIEKSNTKLEKQYNKDLKTLQSKYTKEIDALNTKISNTKDSAQKKKLQSELKALKAEQTKAEAALKSAYETEVTSETNRLTSKYTDVIAQAKDYYEQLYSIKVSGNNKIEYEDKSFAEFEEEFLSSLSSIMSSWASEIESARDSMMSTFDILSEISKKEVVTKDQILQNIKDQNAEYQSYITTMSELNTKLEGTRVLEYIQGLGVDSTDQLKEINSMTDRELSDFVKLYDTKFALATEAGLQQIAGKKEDYNTQIQELFGGIYDNITVDTLTQYFDGTLDGLFTALSGWVNSDGSEVVNKVVKSSLKASAEKTKSTATSAGKTVAKNAVSGAKSQESTFTSAGSSAGAAYVSGIRSQISAAKAAMAELTSVTSTTSTSVGSNVAAGLSSGMSSSTSTVSMTARKLASTTIYSLKDTLKINSPSKVTTEFGVFAAMGLANGILKYTAKAAIAGQKLGDATADAVSLGVDRVSNIIDDISDPVLRPTVDLSGVERSASDIEKMFNSAIATVNVNAVATSATMNKKTSKAEESGTKKTTDKKAEGNTYNFNQYNTSPTALSRIDIYRQTKNQFTQFKEAMV
jgi:hypothetical protein